MPSNTDGPAATALEGDTSLLPVALDAPTTTKPKTNGKAGKEDPDSLGIDVCTFRLRIIEDLHGQLGAIWFSYTLI